MFYKHKSRLHWLQEGDKNTQFFHQYMIHKKKKSKLTYILNSSGQVITDEA